MERTAESSSSSCQSSKLTFSSYYLWYNERFWKERFRMPLESTSPSHSYQNGTKTRFQPPAAGYSFDDSPPNHCPWPESPEIRWTMWDKTLRDEPLLKQQTHCVWLFFRGYIIVYMQKNTYLRPPKSFFFSLNSKICLFAIRRGKQPAGEIPNSGETFRRQENGTAFCIFPFCWEKRLRRNLV